MTIKIDNVIKHINKTGRAVLKMDSNSGFYQLTITKRDNDYLVGEHPGGRVKRYNLADLKAELITHSIYIDSFR